MSDTSASLLDRLQRRPDAPEWGRFVALYTPLMHGWVGRYGLGASDADDVVQEILTIVVRKLPEFRRERTGAFRSWLRHIAVNCVRQFWRRGRPKGSPASADIEKTLNELEDPHSALSDQWDRDHDRHVTRHLLEMIRPRFEEKTWQAFFRVTLDEKAPADVAAELGITVNAVFIAKSRVMTLLRQEGEGILD